jgi:hypothetical protein
LSAFQSFGPRIAAAVTLLVGLALMAVAWFAATPPGTAADETDHYIKALAAGRGDVRGHPTGVESIDPLAAVLEQRARGGPGEAQLRGVRWVAAGARTFTLPTGLVPTSIGCFNNLFRRADTALPANCKIEISTAPGERRFVSYEAVNPPYLYLFPGVAMRLAGDRNVVRAYRLGRAGMGLMCFILLGLSVLLLWDPKAGPLSLVGAMVATTPASVWSFSVLNPSGLEIAGATCWAAAFLRLLRRPAPPGWVWAAAAAGGVALATARSSGPMFVVFIPFCIGLLFGFGRLLSATRRLGGRVVPVAICLGLALAAAVFWLRYIPDYPLGFVVFDYVGDAVSGLPRTLREAVGRFPGDYFIPVYVAVAWAALLVALAIAAAVVATPPARRRLVLVATTVIAFIAAYATAFLTNGFPEFYGRYALPGLIVLPLCAGSLLVERRAQISLTARRRLVVGFTVGTAAIHLLAWWLSARRLAVGTDGPLFFLTDPAWEPPGGWLPWVLTMLVGTVAYALVAVLPESPAPSGRDNRFDDLDLRAGSSVG